MARTPRTNMPATTGRQLPTDWKGELAKHVAQTVEQEASVATGQFITTRAGQLAYQGTPFKDNKIQAVVVDSMLENAFYADKFDPDNPAPPACYAIGRNDKTLAPHPKASDPQSVQCSDCKWNEFGSAEQGNGKACKNIRRLAILPGDDKQLNPASLEKNEFALLKIPVTSVKGWAAYVRMLATLHKTAPVAVVSEISARPDPKTQFKITFEHQANVPDALMPLLMSRVPEASQALETPYPEAIEREAKPAAKKRRKF